LSYGKDNGAINKYIKGAASDAVAAYSTYFGWQILSSPVFSLLIVNVPQSNNTFVQYVLNVNTLAWTRFTGINARCWVVFGNNLYFGGSNGTVYKYNGTLDNGVTQISLAYQSPYLTLSEGLTETTAFRPRMRFDSSMTMTISSSIDFKPFSTPYSVSYSVTGAVWGDPWGTMWSTPNSIINWLNFNTLGYSPSVKLTFASPGGIDFYKMDFFVKTSNRI
jgi:hypothetical protein